MILHHDPDAVTALDIQVTEDEIHTLEEPYTALAARILNNPPTGVFAQPPSFQDSGLSSGVQSDEGLADPNVPLDGLVPAGRVVRLGLSSPTTSTRR